MKVLDTSAILHSYTDFSDNEYLITNDVWQELQSENSKVMVEQGLVGGYIKIRDPSAKSRESVIGIAKETGDLKRLSDTDIGVIALALEMNAEVVSDDYSIQNVARALDIKYHKTAQDGIKKHYVWEKVCPSCGLKYGVDSEICEVCGSKLRRHGKEVTD